MPIDLIGRSGEEMEVTYHQSADSPILVVAPVNYRAAAIAAPTHAGTINSGAQAHPIEPRTVAEAAALIPVPELINRIILLDSGSIDQYCDAPIDGSESTSGFAAKDIYLVNFPG